MVKRFVIAAVIVGLFLGGVAYFNLVFKPKMISNALSLPRSSSAYFWAGSPISTSSSSRK